MGSRALVLGGGGSVGIAWEIGLAAGLAEAGIDLRLADKIVGTSAGSYVGAELAAGRSPASLLATRVETAQRGVGLNQEPRPSELPAPDMEQLMKFMARMPGTEMEAQALRAEIGAFALACRTISEEICVNMFGSIAQTPWPAKYSCTAVDAHDGRFAVLDESTGTSLGRGVASSCSVPSLFPPITINGRRYIDGGMRSPTNFDLAKGYERAIAVAVIPPGGAAFMGARIHPELELLRAGGSYVELITPDAASLDVFGPNLMDSSRQAAVLEVGLKQGRADAERMRSVWS